MNIYKNWLNDVHVSTLESMKQSMEIKEASMDENEDVIHKIGLFELEENGNKLYAMFLIFSHFVKFLFFLLSIIFSLSCTVRILVVCCRYWINGEPMELDSHF
jgi:hypothetical protein